MSPLLLCLLKPHCSEAWRLVCKRRANIQTRLKSTASKEHILFTTHDIFSSEHMTAYQEC